MSGTVSVRMYNVAFGDAFLVSVRRENRTWRMLIDCGSHTQGPKNRRPLTEIVATIVGDLAADRPDGPHLDVLVDTHRHSDHIRGFADEQWRTVHVEEVWLPFVADDSDPDARKLGRALALAAEQLHIALGLRMSALSGAQATEMHTAWELAANSRGNDDAMDRLLGRNGAGFANKPSVRFLPPPTPGPHIIETTIPGVLAHILGPSRDPDDLKRMHPPASSAWLTLNAGTARQDNRGPLFAEPYRADAKTIDARSRDQLKRLKLAARNDDETLIAAAGILERAVNNTSVFIVLDVAGTRLLFPGDAQQGAWDHVLADPASRDLVATAAIYKIAHHGSHNGTPRSFVEEVLQGTCDALLSFGRVEQWAKTIPKQTLLDALNNGGHYVLRADQPVAVDGKIRLHEDLWSEITVHTK